MTHIAAIFILLGLFISSAEAATDASAYTLSELTVDHSDLSLLRTVSDNYVFTPDLSFRGFGEVSSQIATNGGGGDFSQEMNFNAGQYNGLYGMSAQSNSFAWKGATKIKTSVTGTVSTFAYNPSKDEVESIASGLVVADPGTKKI